MCQKIYWPSVDIKYQLGFIFLAAVYLHPADLLMNLGLLCLAICS